MYLAIFYFMTGNVYKRTMESVDDAIFIKECSHRILLGRKFEGHPTSI